MKRKQHGMSLLELLITIAIVGIIAAGIMTALTNAKKGIDWNESNLKAIQAIRNLGQKFENERQTEPRSGVLYVSRNGVVEVDPQQPPANSRRYEYQSQTKIFEDGNALILTTVSGEKKFHAQTTNGFKTDPPLPPPISTGDTSNNTSTGGGAK